MAVDDLWYLTTRGNDGKRLPSKRHGRGDRYRVRWTDPQGKQRTRSFPNGDKSKADALDAQMKADRSRGLYVDPSDAAVTIGEYAPQWLALQRGRVGSLQRLEANLRLHVMPLLGAVAYNRLRPKHLQQWRKDREQVLAATTLRNVFFVVLQPLLQSMAADIGIAPYPWLRDVDLPGVGGFDRRIPTPDEIDAVAAGLPAHWRAAPYLAAGCGTRFGEAMGLEPESALFLARELVVERGLVEAAGEGRWLGPPKTKTSARSVGMADEVITRLSRHMEQFPPQTVLIRDDTIRRKPGEEMKTREARLLFTTAAGNPVPRASFGYAWKAAREAAGLPDLRFHDLRHFFATALIQGGADPKRVQADLGHASLMTTYNIYAGFWPSTEVATRTLIDGVFSQRKGRAA